MKALRLLSVSTLFLALVGSNAVGQQAAGPKATPLQDQPVSGHDGMHSVAVMAEWAPGAATATHTHPGDEYAVVLEGELTLWAEGQPERVVKAREAYFNPRGSIHGARNAGTSPARSIAVFVVDRDVPLLAPVAQ